MPRSASTPACSARLAAVIAVSRTPRNQILHLRGVALAVDDVVSDSVIGVLGNVRGGARDLAEGCPMSGPPRSASSTVAVASWTFDVNALTVGPMHCAPSSRLCSRLLDAKSASTSRRICPASSMSRTCARQRAQPTRVCETSVRSPLDHRRCALQHSADVSRSASISKRAAHHRNVVRNQALSPHAQLCSIRLVASVQPRSIRRPERRQHINRNNCICKQPPQHTQHETNWFGSRHLIAQRDANVSSAISAEPGPTDRRTIENSMLARRCVTFCAKVAL